MKHLTKFFHKTTLDLKIADDSVLLGLSASGDMFIETYQDDALTTYQVTQTNVQIVTQVPSNLTMPIQPSDHPLNKTPLRLRGMRETDRISDWITPLPIIEKMPLMPKLGLSITPMQLLGMVGSTVLSTCQLQGNTMLVCRRVRLAYALPTPQNDADGIPYDYDTHTLYLTHEYKTKTDEAPPLHECFDPIDGITLHTPHDCLRHDDNLIILDSGTDNTPAKVHIWQIPPSA